MVQLVMKTAPHGKGRVKGRAEASLRGASQTSHAKMQRAVCRRRATPSVWVWPLAACVCSRSMLLSNCTDIVIESLSEACSEHSARCLLNDLRRFPKLGVCGGVTSCSHGSLNPSRSGSLALPLFSDTS